MPKVIAITSGKGGVGKTNISVNLAVRLARLNHNVCLFDADLGLANINILLGLTPDHTLEDVINGDKTLNDIIIRDNNSVDIIPGSSGIEIMTEQSHTALSKFIKPLSEMDDYDYIFFDTSAGISRHVIAFCIAAGSLILTVIPEPTSFTDSYALIKVLHKNGFKGRIDVVINRCKTKITAKKIYLKFEETVSKYLKINMNYLGSVVEDQQVSEAVTCQRPFIEIFPDSEASSCIREITSQFLEITHDTRVMTIEEFWNRFTKRMRQPTAEKNIIAQIKQDDSQQQKVSTDEIFRPLQNNISDNVLTALNALVENTAAITMELNGLRKVIEKTNKNNTCFQADKESLTETTAPAIRLDFEKFLLKRKTEKQEAKTNT